MTPEEERRRRAAIWPDGCPYPMDIRGELVVRTGGTREASGTLGIVVFCNNGHTLAQMTSGGILIEYPLTIAGRDDVLHVGQPPAISRAMAYVTFSDGTTIELLIAAGLIWCRADRFRGEPKNDAPICLPAR